MDFSKHLFHPSALGNLMTDSRTKDPIGETCKTELLSCYIEAKYGRHRDLKNKYVEKGLDVEEDSITLYSRILGRPLFKNKETLTNDFFIGTPDIIEGQIVIDIKSSWDIHTFWKNILTANKKYYWQGQAYLDLTFAKTFKLIYVLVNTPLHLIEKEKYWLASQMGAISTESPDAQEALEQLEREMIFDDIDINERWLGFTYERDDEAIKKAKDKLKVCREFLKELDEVKRIVDKALA